MRASVIVFCLIFCGVADALLPKEQHKMSLFSKSVRSKSNAITKDDHKIPAILNSLGFTKTDVDAPLKAAQAKISALQDQVADEAPESSGRAELGWQLEELEARYEKLRESCENCQTAEKALESALTEAINAHEKHERILEHLVAVRTAQEEHTNANKNFEESREKWVDELSDFIELLREADAAAVPSLNLPDVTSHSASHAELAEIALAKQQRLVEVETEVKESGDCMEGETAVACTDKHETDAKNLVEQHDGVVREKTQLKDSTCSSIPEYAPSSNPEEGNTPAPANPEEGNTPAPANPEEGNTPAPANPECTQGHHTNCRSSPECRCHGETTFYFNPYWDTHTYQNYVNKGCIGATSDARLAKCR